MEPGQYLTVAWDLSWEIDAKAITDDQVQLDDLQRAAELLAQRGLAKSIEIPKIPHTEVYVFRLDRGLHGIPATRWFFKVEGQKATFVAMEAIPPDEDDAELGAARTLAS